MKKIFLIITLLLYPLLLLSNGTEWVIGQKSKMKLLVSNDEISIEIKLNDDYKIENLANIKLEVSQKNNLNSVHLVKPNIANISSNKNLSFKIAFTKEKQKAFDSSFTANLTFPLCKENCILENYLISYAEDKKNQPEAFSVNLYNSTNYNQSKEITDHSILYILFISLMGGFILNFMPCVLPVLGIKLSILNKISSKSTKNISLISTICGIIFSYLVIALSVILLKELGLSQGFGFYFQNTNFIIFIIIILTFAASAILDRLFLPIPNFAANFLLSTETKLKSEILIAFIAGCFTTLMSTPCTAPFISIAIAFALQANNLEILSIFFMIGLGLALPYILLIIFPRSLAALPKSGKWMLLFKKFLAAITYCAIFWFTYVVANQLCTLSAVILIMLVLLLKFSIETKVSSLTKFIMTCLLLAGFFTLPSIMNREETKKEAELAEAWHEFDLKQLDLQLKAGKIVIIDVTASWCGTCQLNKFMVLDTEYFANIIIKENIYAMRADVTNEFTPAIKQLMKTKNAYSIPFTIVYSSKHPSGMVLDTILTPSNLNKAIIAAK